ncbi:tetratricopeptide repeat protein [Desulfolutivibrio sulfoxidireducens]|uniref:tetratricopeptide repeat protein n=1 Tax=Desulfolutivibrio sulfoxidireducens TaxID=2773299 RepID=UPI00159E6907|nr:tetratricopeptide repeat protein [Desulfolutivibrio sulfoxidireducens]QLA17736.1 tetratricopeptide repeat protein [Desulfolutivibrio sulfoxidireducens]QLA21310.1 tetratricopeptide repeat protein [Desulfolutivibrio sulfoxidireducens]
MRKTLGSLVFVIMLAVAVSGYAWQKPPFGNVDRNKDGGIVFEEMVIFNPNLTVEVFAVVDVTKDGKVDPGEYAAMGTARGAKTKAQWWKCSDKTGMVLYMKGTEALVAGNNREAAAVLGEAIAQGNLCVDYLSYAYYNRGIAFMRLGDDANARKCLDKARALNINDVVPPNDFGLSGTPRHKK